MKSKTLRGEKGGDTAKLFARHFKLEEHVSYLRRARIGAAVGTPGRIGKLLCETGWFIQYHPFIPISALLTKAVRRIVSIRADSHHTRCILPRRQEKIPFRHSGKSR